MKYIIPLLVILLTSSVPAYALLQDNLDGTVTQTRNDGSQLMWLKDANYAKTSGYDADGWMDWYQAQAWISYLNNSNHLGYNDWRLPINLPVNGSTYDYTLTFDGSTDRSVNISAPGTIYAGTTASEMAYLYYVELDNLGRWDIYGNDYQPGWGLVNTGLFTNMDANWANWSGTEYGTEYGVHFDFVEGYQHHNWKMQGANTGAWAVRSAGVVPEPISSILFITGGTLLAGRRYFMNREGRNY